MPSYWMIIELLNKYKVIERIYIYWVNRKLLNKQIIIE